MKMLATVLLASIVFEVGLSSQSHKHVSKTWVPAVYHGLVMGKTTRADVLRALGKPTWVGHESDTGTPMMDFTASDPVRGTLSVLFGRGGIVAGMRLSPKEPITEKDIVRILGSDFLVVRYATDDCLSDAGTAPMYESSDGPIRQLEYRNRGLAVSFHGTEVEDILFVEKPFGPTHSRCQGQRKKHPAQP